MFAQHTRNVFSEFCQYSHPCPFLASLTSRTDPSAAGVGQAVRCSTANPLAANVLWGAENGILPPKASLTLHLHLPVHDPTTESKEHAVPREHESGRRRGNNELAALVETSSTGIMGAFSHSAHSANYFVACPWNTPENHPPTEACTINSKRHGVQNLGPWDLWQASD